MGKDAVAGCGNSELLDCEGVLASRWAKWMYMPVSILAALVYACLLGAGLFLALNANEDRRPAARFAVLFLSLMAGGAALWFVGLQLFALDGFCPFCMAIHACGLTLAGLSILLMVMEGPLAVSSFATPLAASAVGLVILIGGQLAVRPPSIQTATGDDLIAGSPVELGMSDSAETAGGKDSADENNSLADLDSPLDDADFPALPKAPSVPGKPKLPGSVDISFIEDAVAVVDEEKVESLEPEDFDPDALSESSTQAEPEQKESAEPVEKTARRVSSFAIGAPAAVDGMVDLFGGKVKIKMDDVILLGSPRAPHIIVELFDYSCPHCRALHWKMEEVHNRYGDQIAVIMLPVPLNAGCNDTVKQTGAGHENACIYARLAIAVWQKRRSQFPAFHARLIEGPDLPQPGQMRYEAGKIIGNNELDDALLSEDIDKQMKIGIELYKLTKQGTIPKLILGEAVATGKFDNSEELFELFESTLELKPLEDQ